MIRLKSTWHVSRLFLFALILFVPLLLLFPFTAAAGPAVKTPEPAFTTMGEIRTIRVGVLAYRGAKTTEKRWQPLIDYLNASLQAAGLSVRLVLHPVTLDSTRVLLEAGQIDYLLTNPGHYVSLARDVPLAPIATMERFAADGKGLIRFGSVIFTRTDNSAIKTLTDLKERSVTAVSPDAFGGFQVAWAEFVSQDIHPFQDFAALRFAGFPQDAIVDAVLRGETDAGIVRTGLLETMAREGRVDLSRIRVLQAGRYPEWPFLVSTRLYPEWPFLARGGIDQHLTEAIARALLETQDEAVRKTYGLRVAWTTPQPYEGVRRLVFAYEAWRRNAATGSTIASLRIAAPLILALLLAAGLVVHLLMRNAGVGRNAIGKAAGNDKEQGDSLIASANPPAVSPTLDPEIREVFRKLTPREQQVLSLLCQGKSTKAIASELAISPKTVEHYRASLLKKTGVKSATSLVWLATRQGFDRMRDSEGGNHADATSRTYHNSPS